MLHIILKFQKILHNIIILYYLHDYIHTKFQTRIASFITRTLNYNNAPFLSTYTAALYAYTAIINRNCIGVPEIERKLDVLASGIFHFLRGFNIHFFFIRRPVHNNISERAAIYYCRYLLNLYTLYSATKTDKVYLPLSLSRRGHRKTHTCRLTQLTIYLHTCIFIMR